MNASFILQMLNQFTIIFIHLESIINIMKQDDSYPPNGAPSSTEPTLQSLSQISSQLSSLYQTNLTLRMKYPTEPLRFYQSQQSLDNLLQSLLQLSQEHLPIIVQANVLPPVLKLMNHPNEDINMACIQFLHEIVAEEPQNDRVFEVYYRMAAWMAENGIYQALVQTIMKMKEEESVQEYQVALKILKIIQTLSELLQSSIEPLISQTKILDYLSNRIMPNYKVQHKVIDDNKYVSSDLLAFLLSNSQEAQLKFHQLCGMEILVESIRPYIDAVAKNNDEKQYVGNLFDCCNILMINQNQQLLKSKIIYHKMKGNQIMLQFIKNKHENSIAALKAIANSFIGLQTSKQAIIEELIDFGALKYIFAIVMRQGLKGKEIDQQMGIDQNCLRIVLQMIVSTSEIYKMRVEAKLTQKRYCKLQKMFQIRNEYMQNMGKQALIKDISAEQYFQRLKQGLGVVEVIDLILSHLTFSASTVRDKLGVFMKLYGVLPQDVEFSIKNKYKYVGEGSDKVQLERILSENVPLLYQLTKKQEKEEPKQTQ